MANLLEITGDDIAKLDDAALRELIGLLCEADYRSEGLSTKGITWGGHQDAPDGGLDVVVRCEDNPPKVSFIPRKVTGFQVKKPDMPKAKIIAEMKPKGYLRDEIKDLIKEGGAYIIVSSSGSTSDTALKNRIDAMREAVSKERGNDKLIVDFFDRNRIASWVRLHSAMILWVRNKTGQDIQGWSSYNNWANAPGGIEEEYLLDKDLRLYDGTQAQRNAISIQDGLLALRITLSVPKASVRLAGLSGVGKTRLVQALFDERIGSQTLNPSLALYTDISYNPEPSPQVFAEQLVMRKTRAILIVDNCPPELHRRLTQICSQQDSNVSLLTIEYDIREDIPDETNVFRLEPASEELIEKIINKRYQHISQVDAHTIAHFSGGNARMAIALANTVKRNESLSDFSDDELFKRLFWQRQNLNENLLVSAEVCSLVYSFEGEDTRSEKSELVFLAALVNKTGYGLYRDVSVLRERDLIQSRGVWRAVLPHAIANRLAKRALNAIPKDVLIQAFFTCKSERIISSLSKRLSYLHDCQPAVEIVSEWLAPDGWLGKENCNFNQLGINVFSNVAPVSPESALSAMERAANNDKENYFLANNNIYRRNFVNILSHIAYDPKLFNRSINLLTCFALLENRNEHNNPARDSLKSLFWITLSGTHASVDARAGVIKDLLTSEDEDRRQLALDLLFSALEAWNFYSSHDFRFGARPRDYGYHPKTREEVDFWFNTFINICTDLALSSQTTALKARKLLADKMRGLWTKGSMYETLDKVAQNIHRQKAWNEGWLAVREIIQYDSKSFDKETSERLFRLEKILKPANLLERARVFALSNQFDRFDVEDELLQEDDESSSRLRADKITRELGIQVAQDSGTFEAFLPEIVSTYASRLYIFGQGLADGSHDKQATWQILYNQYKMTEPEKRQFVVLIGYLSSCAESAPDFYNSTLDSLVKDEHLGMWFPFFQGAVTIDQRGVERLHEALDTGHVKVDTFRDLAWGRRHEAISDDDLAELLTKLQKHENGAGVVLDILRMRFHETEEKQIQHSKKLIEFACDLLKEFPFVRNYPRSENTSYTLAQIAKACFISKFGVKSVLSVCEHLAELIAEYRISPFEYTELFNTIARIKPSILLDVFLENKKNIENYAPHLVFKDGFDEHNHFIDQIAIDDLTSWCEIAPQTRYPLLALATKPFSRSIETKEVSLNPITYLLFSQAPNLPIVLQYLSKSLLPTSWSDSLAEILSKRAELLKALFEHENEEIKSWATEQYSFLQKKAIEARDDEEKRNRLYNERFE
ncbi:MAG: hypothetical protein B6D38_00730 [Anaerolineae bacterium UTCFX1]|nr:MAG: hypothetical protein B6D38_00730 [Anaerolineae bacterium UTCFX1]